VGAPAHCVRNLSYSTWERGCVFPTTRVFIRALSARSLALVALDALNDLETFEVDGLKVLRGFACFGDLEAFEGDDQDVGNLEE
jgi:hypothetical protein